MRCALSLANELKNGVMHLLNLNRRNASLSSTTEFKGGAKVIRYSPEAGREEAEISSNAAANGPTVASVISTGAFRLMRAGANAELSLLWASSSPEGRPPVVRVA